MRCEKQGWIGGFWVGAMLVVGMLAGGPAFATYEAAAQVATAVLSSPDMTRVDCPDGAKAIDSKVLRPNRDRACATTTLALGKFTKAWDLAIGGLREGGMKIVAETDWRPGATAELRKRSYYVGRTPLTVVYHRRSRQIAVTYSNYSWNLWPCDAAKFEADRSLLFVGQDPTVIPPKLTSGDPPPYPELARVARQQGRVLLAYIVETDGTVSDACVAAPHDWNVGFEEVAIETVRQWKFEPAMRDGQPVRALTTSPLDFHLEEPR